ncbi:hypothetical protein Q8A67_008271 [Cirrhinus molitorella]|uniref:Uncharacterized protein n=1 Tax=Cirrhinus molitorella TaxID=172907 RepID=A0AA88Q1A7_9TELE|nr:hypothetical protein Q8A67_008271 [Cirrhinus molitorella]
MFTCATRHPELHARPLNGSLKRSSRGGLSFSRVAPRYTSQAPSLQGEDTGNVTQPSSSSRLKIHRILYTIIPGKNNNRIALTAL